MRRDPVLRRWFRRSFRAAVDVAPEFIRRGVARLPFSRFNRITSALLHGEERIVWEGVHILVDPGEMIGFYTYLFQDSQRIEVDYLTSVCAQGDTFFDVGANRAWVSLALAHHCRHLRVVAFEPDPRILQMARENLALNPDLSQRIALRQHAVGDKIGESSFVRSPADNLGTGRLDDAAHEDTIKVPCLTLDSVCQELDVWPDVVKIDVEGAELAVLRGMSGLFRTRPPKAMLIELHGFYLTDSTHFYRDIYRLLREAGYELRQMHEDGFRQATAPSEWPSRLHLAAVL